MLTAKAQAEGRIPVIVRLNVNFKAERGLYGPAAIAQQNAISKAQNSVVKSLLAMNTENMKQFRFVPYLAMTVNANALQSLAKNPNVIEISEDIPVPPTMAESTGVVGADTAWGVGYDGSGWAVAVLDTGVDKNHNFLSGKVVSEACYSTTNILQGALSLCPGGVAASTATNSGLNCSLSTAGCAHGTHVAGTVTGQDYTPNGPGYNGVARGANIIAIQVFSRFTGSNCTNFGLSSPCALSYESDQILGLERVYALRTSFNIAAVNMSLGGGRYFSYCDGEPHKPIIDSLRAAGIATVISSGNSSYTTAIGSPACISTAISVGSTCDSAAAGYGCTAIDHVPSYSNIASFISLLAPGSVISSSVPGTNTFASWHGTSMAAPHVAGAWALMKQQDPAATVATVLSALQDAGTSVDDQRAAGSVTDMRRINVDQALLPRLAAPTFTFPLGGEDLLAGSATVISWNSNEPPESSAVPTYDLAYTDNCTTNVYAVYDMENGAGPWNVSHGAGSLDWALGTGNPHGGSFAWFASDPATVSDQYLATSAPVTVPAAGELRFWHSYDIESGYDGGVVEISSDAVNWSDLGSFMIQAGYNGIISSSFGNPVGGRAAFTGDSNGYIETRLDLGSYAGQSVYFRFRMATDTEVSAVGWYVDDVTLTGDMTTWVPIATTAPEAVSLPWSVAAAAGDDYCLSIQGKSPDYLDSPVVTSASFTVSADSDGDGLSDEFEITVLDTDPFDVDSDDDGLVDGSGGLVPLAVLPGGVDVNLDGFVDGEQDFGTSPVDSDSDGDGVSDGDEIGLYGIDPTLSNIGDVGPSGSPDNVINLGDLIVLTRLVTGIVQPTLLESVLGDINDDDQLGVADILLLQQAIFTGIAP